MSIHRAIQQILPRLQELRHALHQQPELSGNEHETASRLQAFLAETDPDEVITELGGYGLALIYRGEQPGPTILIRAELDALPITEVNSFPYRSRVNGVSHKCGHDGHAAMVAGLGLLLARKRSHRGRVVLLFQPAEETGTGAAAVVEDPQFDKIKPDFAFALHNLPGHPMGTVRVKSGPFNCASRGMIIKLSGKTSHAAHPEDGKSPDRAMCRLIEGLNLLSNPEGDGGHFRLVTVIHARLGEVAFGTAPGEAVVMATLRAETNEAMTLLIEEAAGLARQQARHWDLHMELDWCDVFGATVNDSLAVEMICSAAVMVNGQPTLMTQPNRWSEDFGRIAETCRGAMFCLGAGEDTPQLHNPDYDFPDSLLSTGIHIFWEILARELNQS